MTIVNKAAHAAGLLLDDEHAPGSIEARRARLQEPHMAELTAFAQRIALERDERVPDFDPASAGRRARVLLLFQDPSEVAANGSRLVSRHNNDRTAHNTYLACEEAGLDYARSIHWNVIPWWAQDPLKALPNGKARSIPEQATRSRRYLSQLLDCLPELSVIVLLGTEAQRAWNASDGAYRTTTRVLTCPNPGPQAWNNKSADGTPNRDLIVQTLRRAAERTA